MFAAPRASLAGLGPAVAMAVAMAMAMASGSAMAQPAAPVPASGTGTRTAPGVAAPSTSLREANGAAQLGDWAEVERLVAPLTLPAVRAQLAPADAAELHRLLGLTFFFTDRVALAEAELWAYLQLDLDAHLDPATVPPEAITFFESIAAKHRAELRALREARTPRPPPSRSRLLSFVPVASQVQNGERTKAWIYGVSLGGLAATNLASYLLLRRWCREGDGTCDRTGVDHTSGAKTLSVVNLVSGVGLILVTGLAAVDGLRGYRRGSLRVSPAVGAAAGPAIGAAGEASSATFGLSLEGSF